MPIWIRLNYTRKIKPNCAFEHLHCCCRLSMHSLWHPSIEARSKSPSPLWYGLCKGGGPIINSIGNQ